MKHWKCGVLAVLVVALAHTTAAAQVETTIYALQQDMHTIGEDVLIDSVVVIGVDVRPSTYGVYVQEPDGGPYSGILCYTSGTFPAYECSGGAVKVGDLINATGQYSDFNGLAEVVFPVFEKLGEVVPPAPVVLPVDSLSNNAPDGGEKWEGVLVQVQNVRVISVNNFRDWRIENFGAGATGDSMYVYEKMIGNQLEPVVGDSLATVTGVADWAFGDRRIAPRGNEDIVLLTGGPPPAPDVAWSSAENEIRVQFPVELNETQAETVLNYTIEPTFDPILSAVYDNATRTVTLTTGVDLTPSTTPHTLTMQNVSSATGVAMDGIQSINFIGGISTIEFVQTPISASNDSSQVANQQVTIRGVVTASGDCVDFFPDAVGGFYVQDRSSSTFGGLFVFGPPSLPTRGDSVLVSGFLTEFGVGPTTELTGIDEFVNYGSVTPIAGVPATLADVTGDDNTAEQYESMLVTLSNAEVITEGLEFAGDPFDITDAADSDTLRVDDDAVDEGSLRMNGNGTTGYLASPYDVMNVTGIMTFSGTAPFQRLQPRNWNEPTDGGDIELLQTVSDTPALRYRTQLFQNDPNPFNPTTRIRFTIGNAGPASLRIYDLRGRLVATLFDEHRAAGPGQFVWDGRDDSGRKASSGVYWYRLNSTGSSDHVRKMVLLK